MSKYVDDILHSIRKNPEKWVSISGGAIKSGDIKITGHGNGALLSVISLYINGKYMHPTYLDNFRLEKAITKWFKGSSLVMQLKGDSNE